MRRRLSAGWRSWRRDALEVKYQSTDPDSIRQETQRFREIGLEEGRHFLVKMPEGARETTSRFLGRVWRTLLGCLNTALGGNGSWRRSS
jgi:hypothetical protein